MHKNSLKLEKLLTVSMIDLKLRMKKHYHDQVILDREYLTLVKSDFLNDMIVFAHILHRKMIRC